MDLLPGGIDLLDSVCIFKTPQILQARVVARGPLYGGGKNLTITGGNIWINGNLLNPYGISGRGIKVDGLRFGEASGKGYLLFTPWGSVEYLFDITDTEPPLTGDISIALNDSGELMGGFDGTLILSKPLLVRAGYKYLTGEEEYHFSIESWIQSVSASLGYARLPCGEKGMVWWFQWNLPLGTSIGLSYDGTCDVLQESVIGTLGPYQIKLLAESGSPTLIQGSRTFTLGNKATLLTVALGADMWGFRGAPRMAFNLESTFRLGPFRGIKYYAGYSKSRWGTYFYSVGEYRTPGDLQVLVTYLEGDGGHNIKDISPGFSVSVGQRIEF